MVSSELFVLLRRRSGVNFKLLNVLNKRYYNVPGILVKI